jgi:Recombination endonuclease VII
MSKRPPHKVCSTCKVTKYFKDFSKNKSRPDGYHNQCKVCRSKYNPPRKSSEKSKIRLRAWNRLKSSGFTQEDYNQKLQEQNGRCAICGIENDNTKDLCADHDHKTGKKRGLLCHKCNTGIGLLQDDINILCKATDYLIHYSL